MRAKAVPLRITPALAVLLCAGAAAAQRLERPGTAGVEGPARSLLLDDDATALAGNPGSLAFAGKLQLDFVHEAGGLAGARQGNGLYLSGGLGSLVLGGALEWLRPGEVCAPDAPCDRRSTLGLGLRLGRLGLGASVHRHHSDENVDLDHLTTWDVGAAARPLRWLSLGFAALDVGGPRSGQLAVPRRYAISAGLRPTGDERLTLAADAFFRPCGDPQPAAALPASLAPSAACGGAHPDLRFTAELALLPGLRLIGQLGRDADAQALRGQIGLQLDFAHVGVRGAQEITDAGGRTSFKARLSQETLPAFDPFGRRAVELDLDRALRGPRPGLIELALSGGASPDPLALTLATLRRLARDPGVVAVALRTSGLPVGRAGAEELRTGIEGLRRAGKKVIFYLESGGDLEYYVATSADRIFAAPQAVLAVNGFSATAIFAAAGLAKLGVKAEFFRVGAYKNAPDLFTRSASSKEQREVQEALLDDVYARFLRAVTERRGVGEAELKGLLDRGLLEPGEAVKTKLLDGLIYPDQLGEEVGKLLGIQAMKLDRIGVQPPAARDLRWGPRERIGVVRIEGDIAATDRPVPVGPLQIAAAHAIARRVRALADDPGIRALVVRIDSPGGDGNASDLIWRELSRARREKHKRVVASLGDVAASGGYYVAVGADEIVAEPSTITGSIGVFIGHFDASELYGKLGLSFSTVRRGASADLFSTSRGLSDRERGMLQHWVETFYGTFLQRVAEGRGLSLAQVDAVARGRVWSGAQALELRLVDRLGGFEDALRRAKELSGLAADDEVAVLDEERPGADLLEAAVSGAASRVLEDSPVVRALPRKDAERALRAVAALGEPGTVRARMPVEFELR